MQTIWSLILVLLTNNDEECDSRPKAVYDDAERGDPPSPLSDGALQGLLDRRCKVMVGRERQDDQRGHDERQ